MRGRTGQIVVILIFAATMLQMIIGVVGGFEAFNGKGFVSRIIAYPMLMLVAPVFWWLRNRSTDKPAPWGAFALIMAPFLIDVTGNTLNLYDSIEIWDDINHFVNWFLLCLGLGLLIGPSSRRWHTVLTIAGLGAILAIGWELGEWYVFIRRGVELETAYQDTLLDEALGTLGAMCAGLVVALRAPAHSESVRISG